MEQYDDGAVPYLLQLKNEIETNSNKWSLKTIRQAERSLYSIVCQLKNVYNSKLRINQVNPDILYRIFTMVVYWTPSPCPTDLLTLSHVCHHWRESALGWPALWALIDLESPMAIVDLFLERSQDAPLTLLWENDTFDEAPSNSYFMQHVNHILSRLCYLIVSATYTDFASFYRAFQHSGLPALQLRRCEISLYKDDDDDDDDDEDHVRTIQPPIAQLVDSSCLRQILLTGLDLPWLDLPLNRLTHLTLDCPMNLPALSQFLVFLSNCRFLRVLELDFDDGGGFCNYGIRSSGSIMTTSPSPLWINKVVLSDLASLELKARGPLSREYIRRFSECIQISGALSSFELHYDYSSRARLGRDQLVPTWPVPRGTFTHFSSCQSLLIDMYSDECKRFNISGRTSVGDRFGPLNIWCEGLPYSLVLELVHAMPEIRHLKLKLYGWQIFTLENFNVRNAFPCLHTLELAYCTTEALNSLPSSLQLETLILNHRAVSFGVLLDVVLKLGVKILDIGSMEADESQQGADVIATLRRRGVCVFHRKIDHPV